MKICTWHIHGSYLYYLTHCKNHTFYVPYTKTRKEPGYLGKTTGFPWENNLVEVPVDEMKNLNFDIILFQSCNPTNAPYKDRFKLFSEAQLQLPKIYLEHDPPQQSPTDTKHLVDDPSVLLVHVTHFNNLMWDSNRTPTTVVDHGVTTPDNVSYKGDLQKGIVVINNLQKRGRRLGLDIFETVRKEIPLDIIGMGTQEIGGLGEVAHELIPEFISQYRFFFNPIRYTSLGLSVCEALMTGMPIVGLASTEIPTVIKNGMNGFIDTNINTLIENMKILLENHNLAKTLSKNSRSYALQRFNINRFVNDWESVFKKVTHSL